MGNPSPTFLLNGASARNIETASGGGAAVYQGGFIKGNVKRRVFPRDGGEQRWSALSLFAEMVFAPTRSYLNALFPLQKHFFLRRATHETQ
jgi:hypothetical protein